MSESSTYATGGARFPFSAVVGAEEAKLALLLAAIEPGLGGVLLRGDKGSAKSTLARGLAGVLGPTVPFVDLPLGATEERVVGSLDLAAALGDGEVRLQLGLLAAAHGGVLYVDEVNLLGDHLVDVLLDAAASGVNLVERDGISRAHEARFLLVGSMNPEEGELRPQLLDRFGLAVEVRNPAEAAARAEIVRRRSAHDRDPAAFARRWAEAEAALAAQQAAARARLAPLPDDVLLTASELCVAAGADSLRADLALGRAAAAHAAWSGRERGTIEDLRAVAPLALAHRRHRHPLHLPADDRPDLTPPGAAGAGSGGASGPLDAALDAVLGPPPADAGGGGGAGGGGDEPGPEGEGAGAADPPAGAADPPVGTADPPAGANDAVSEVLTLRAPRTVQPGASGRRSAVETARGRRVGDRAPEGPVGSVALVPTLRAAAARGRPPSASGPGVHIEAADLREPVREARSGNLLVLAVDASGSMEADRRMDGVRAALVGLLVDAYQRRDRVALVTFGGRGAEVVLRPTGSVEVARSRLAEVRTGGDTPLADGIRVAAELAGRSATPTLRPLLVVVTDGRATAGPQPWEAARSAAEAVRRSGLPAVVIDVEATGSPAARLGLAAELAGLMAARHVPLPTFSAGGLQHTLRHLAADDPAR